MKKNVNVFDYAETILKEVQKGVLLTTCVDGKVNTMTISWGTLGIEWGKKIFTTFVRTNRYTKELLEKNPEFIISIPIDKIDRKILASCGTISGKDQDKIKINNLTLEDGEMVTVPAIKELPLTLECKVIYSQLQDRDKIPQNIKDTFYPEGVKVSAGENDSYHIAFYGEILNSYIVE